MKLVDVHARLLEMEVAVFQTSDAAACLNINNVHASKLLARLSSAGHLVHLNRGLWAFKDRVESLALPEYLTNPFPSYVSLQSALYYHELISQIPTVIYAVSISRTKKYETPLGVVSVHHVNPSFFFGFESMGRGIAKVATPEKALIDFFYLSPARSNLFRALPELEFPKNFSAKKARRIIGQIRSVRRQTLVKRLFEEVMSRLSESAG
jgi:predicted transcriptional regulator of viral defense system